MQSQGEHSHAQTTPDYEHGPRLPATTHLRQGHSTDV